MIKFQLKIKLNNICYVPKVTDITLNKKKSSQSSQTNAVIQCMNKVKERNSTQGSLG